MKMNSDRNDYNRNNNNNDKNYFVEFEWVLALLMSCFSIHRMILLLGLFLFVFVIFFLCHPQDVLELYFVVYINICNSVFYATESTGSTRCWNIKEGRWNQCRLT